MDRPGAQDAADEEEESGLHLYVRPVEMYNLIRFRNQVKPLFLQRSLSYKREKEQKFSFKDGKRPSNFRLRVIEVTPARPGFLQELSLKLGTVEIIVMEATAVNGAGIQQASERQFTKRKSTSATMKFNAEGGLQLPITLEMVLVDPSGKLASKQNQKSMILLVHEMTEKKGTAQQVEGAEVAGQRAGWAFLPLSSACQAGTTEAAGTGSQSTLHVLPLQEGYFKELQHGKDAPTIISFESSSQASTSQSEALTVKLNMEVEPLGRRRPAQRSLSGKVLFKYWYHNMQQCKQEVTRQFTCPFCVTRCRSFQGLRWHLKASHDFFSFEFENAGCKTASVHAYIKREMLGDQGQIPLTNSGYDNPAQKEFLYASFAWSKNHQRLEGRSSGQSLSRASLRTPGEFKLQAPVETSRASSCGGASSSFADEDSVAAQKQISRPKRKPKEHLSDYLYALPHRTFYHSRTGLPMDREEVEADVDSEDEVDEEAAVLEERMWLDEFEDVLPEEKEMVHMWNRFISKNRVMADGHMPWACKSFAAEHAAKIGSSSSLRRVFTLFLVQYHKFNLIDGFDVDHCLRTITGDKSSYAKCLHWLQAAPMKGYGEP